MRLEIDKISRRDRHTGEPLLNEISLTITGGESIALRGRSGSGKSLLLRAIALLDPLAQGTIHWNGQAVSGNAIPDYRRQVVYLPQQAVVAEDTVEEALRRPFLYRSSRSSPSSKTNPFDQAQTVKQLQQLDRPQTFLAKRNGDLSGGEKQITALLRALAVGPTVLLLDEATSALDAETTQAAEQLIHTWQTENTDARTAIWVSHDASQADRVASRKLKIEAGRLQESAL